MKLENDKRNKNKKIMFVTPYFYPKIGGLENYVYNIALGLKEKYNWDIVIITSNHEQPKQYKEEMIKGMKVYRLPRLLKVSNTPINPMWFWQIKKIVKKEQPNIINGHSPVPFIADVAARVAKSQNVPFALTYHAGSMKKGKLLQDSLIIPYENLILNKTKRLSEIIICSSDFVKNKFIKNENATVVNPGVKLSKSKDYNYKDKKVIYVGKIEKSSNWKGIKYLIEAMSKVQEKIKDSKLVLIGEGDQVIEYGDLAKKLKVKAEFTGRKTGYNLEKEYANSSVLVLPSITEAESFGMVLIESMAYKKPVIGTNMGGIPYVIDEGKNGLIVPPKNSKALADAILKILNNSKLAKQMGENGYNKVKNNFTWNIQVEKTNKLFKKMIK